MSNNYHSLLFVPATERLLQKANNTDADAVIIDLEDSIPADDKDTALERLISFLEGYSFNTDLYIRINPDRIMSEIPLLNNYEIKGYMLPKAERTDEIDLLAGMAGKKRIIVLIESPLGILNARAIAENKNTYMLAFGGEDYTSECGIENKDEYLAYPKGKLVACAKAYGKKVFDTISLNIRDMEKYRIDAQRSKSYGFDGKLAIHPAQVEVINKIFKDDIKDMRSIIREYDKSGEAVIEINGRIYEKPHIEAMRKQIKEYKL